MKTIKIAIGIFLTPIVAMGNANVVLSAETLLGLGSGGALYRIDENSAGTTQRGSGGVGNNGCRAMAYNPNDKHLYAVCGSLDSSQGAQLVKVNPNTSQPTGTNKTIDVEAINTKLFEVIPDRDIAGQFELIDIAFDNNGVLYGYLSGPRFGGEEAGVEGPVSYVEVLTVIDVGTGKVKNLGESSCHSIRQGPDDGTNAPFRHAITFQDANTLIHALGSSPGTGCPSGQANCLETISLQNGTSCTFNGDFSALLDEPSIVHMSNAGADNTLFYVTPFNDLGQIRPHKSVGKLNTDMSGGIALVPLETPGILPNNRCPPLCPLRRTLGSSQVEFKVANIEPTTTGSAVLLTSTVGDADNFRSGNPADKLDPSLGNQSANVTEILKSFTPKKNLDEVVNNTAVGLTHFANVPTGSQVENATATFTFRGTAGLENDTILFNDSKFISNPPPGFRPGFGPYIALQDILTQNVIGITNPDKVLQKNKSYTLRIDLSRVPVRQFNRGTITGSPDALRDLRPLLRNQGHFDMVFTDDTEVDGSLLRAVARSPVGGSCSTGSAGIFHFTATLKNLMGSRLNDLRIKVNQSTSPGVELLLPNGRRLVPTNETSLTDLVPTSTGALSGGESVFVPFALCLPNFEKFSFFVDVTANGQ